MWKEGGRIDTGEKGNKKATRGVYVGGVHISSFHPLD